MATIDEIKIVVKAEVDAAIAKMQALDKTVKDNSKSGKDLAKDIAGLTTGYNLGVQAAQSVLRTMGDLVVTSVKLAAAQERVKMEFSVLTGSMDIGNKLFADMNRLAAQTPLEMADITAAGKQLLSVGIPVGEVTEKLRMLGDVAMGNPEKLDRLTSAFAQLKSKGVASMEQLNRFVEAGVPIMAELGKQTGLSGDELFKYVSAGKIGFADVETALRSMTGEGGLMHDMMKKVADTAEGKFSTAMDAAKMKLADMGKTTLPILTALLDDFNKAMERWDKAKQGAKIVTDQATFANMIGAGDYAGLNKLITNLKDTDPKTIQGWIDYWRASRPNPTDAQLSALGVAQRTLDSVTARRKAEADAEEAAKKAAAAAEKAAKALAEKNKRMMSLLIGGNEDTGGYDLYDEKLRRAAEFQKRFEALTGGNEETGPNDELALLFSKLGGGNEDTAGYDATGAALYRIAINQRQWDDALAASAESMQRIMETGYLDVMTAFGRSLFDSADGADALAESIANLGESLLDAAPGIMLELALKAGAAGNIPAAVGFVAAAGAFAVGGGMVDVKREKKSSTTNVSNVHVYNVQGSVIAQSQLDNMSARASTRADRGW